MLKVLSKFIFLTVIVHFSIFRYCSGQEVIPAWFCITEDEYALFKDINEFRKSNFLNPVPLSKSLSYVARQNVNDLNLNKPFNSDCNFHSWSEGGKFEGCCFRKKNPDFSCVRNKPKELTKYKGEGYELVYWENGQAFSDAAMDEWKTITPSKDIILNRANWNDLSWNAMGVAIEGNFALLWFGIVKDTESEITVCGTDNTIVSRPDKINESNQKSGYQLPENNRSYVVVGSFTNLEEAKKEFDKCKSKGYQDTRIIFSEGKYRVSAADFSGKEEAQKYKNKINSVYKSAWVMTF